jgi:hypothetical protein
MEATHGSYQETSKEEQLCTTKYGVPLPLSILPHLPCAPLVGRNVSGPSAKPDKKSPTRIGQFGRAGLGKPQTRTIRSISLPPEDTSILSTRHIMAMSQNELLDCILSRLEELEKSQDSTTLKVRTLTGRLTDGDDPTDYAILDPDSSTESLKDKYEQGLEQEIDVMMSGDGEPEAWMLTTMRRGTPVTQIPFEQIKMAH